MKIPLYQIDAFASAPFEGNPAAVCPLEDWLPDDTLQAIAVENNLSETAFFVEASPDAAYDYDLRWFTPGGEVDLCGHATLASGSVVFSRMRPGLNEISFMTQSGILGVARDGDKLVLDFPTSKPARVDIPEGLVEAVGLAPDEFLLGGRDYLLVYRDADMVHDLSPDFRALLVYGQHGFIATAQGEDCDFVSRCFYPVYDIDEDPVTGSAHVVSGPYWAERLGKSELFARQISARGGDLWLRVQEERILIAGHCVEVVEGVMTI